MLLGSQLKSRVYNVPNLKQALAGGNGRGRAPVGMDEFQKRAALHLVAAHGPSKQNARQASVEIPNFELWND